MPAIDEGEDRSHATVPCMHVALVTPMRPMFDTPRALAEPERDGGTLATLTVLRGCDVGRAYALDADEVIIGREPTCGVWIDDACVSRGHARVARDDEGRHAIVDLGSTNGTFVGARRLAAGEVTTLANGARVQIGPTALLRFALVDARDSLVQRDLFHAATRDPLSGAYNRRYFEERLDVELARARRARLPLSLLMIDVDGMKAINDARGHLAGDAVLRDVVACVSGHVRVPDVVARWGGDELVLVAPAADRHEASRLAERLRAEVASLAIRAAGAELRVTLSVGVAGLDEIVGGPGELVALADARLYRAKRAGKNRVLATG